MPNFIDLTGRQFGRLTVIKRATNHGKQTYWTCLCECGSVKDVGAAMLKNGHTRSCGCLKSQNLVGQEFGRWNVIGKAAIRGSNTYWHCKCECGTIKEVCGIHLKSGASKSCGCLAIELFIDRMAGQVGELSPSWVDDDIGYHGVHQWIGKFKLDACEICNKTDRRIEAHNIDGKYRRRREDWVFLCCKCHNDTHKRLRELGVKIGYAQFIKNGGKL